MVNALVCIQSHNLKRLVEEFESWLVKLDESLPEDQKLICTNGLDAFNDLLRVDYTTLNGITGLKIFRENPKLLDAYVKFSENLDWHIPHGISLANIQVVEYKGINAKVHLEIY